MRIYRHVFRMGMEKALEYRMDFFLTLTSALFPIVMQVVLWNYLYGNGDTAALTGYSYGQMMVYTLFAAIISRLIDTKFENEINLDIKEGGLNKYLTKPIKYDKYQLFSFLGQKSPQLVMNLVILAVIFVVSLFVFRMEWSLWRVGLFLVSLVFALLLNFGIFYCLAMLSFRLQDVGHMFEIVSVTLVVISGGIVPLDIFGDTVTKIVYILPFTYTTQFPVNIINGRFTLAQSLGGFAVQVAWVLFFWLLGKLMWQNGLKKYIAVGG